MSSRIVSRDLPDTCHLTRGDCQGVPRGVVCFLSALHFHGLTDELPFEVWLPLPGSWTPRAGTPPTRVVRFSGASFTEGVNEHEIETVLVRIYSPAKTVADLFKSLRTVGLNVAIAALRVTLEKRRVKPTELIRYAAIRRVLRVMQMYWRHCCERIDELLCALCVSVVYSCFCRANLT